MKDKGELELLKLEISNLKLKLESKEEENRLKDNIVIQQSKMAAMGEMIENIAHQYRQPLMEISTILMDTEAKIKLLGSVSNDDTLKMINKSNIVLKYLSQTIDDFRNFFTKNKEKEFFYISEPLSTSINIMKESLSSKNIKLNIILKDNLKSYGVKNEYTQVMINIISNAMEAIVSKGIENGRIDIKVYKRDDNSIVEINDNGKGIMCKPIDDVFKPFFTYKKQNGTGIGLFMSKLIVEKNMGGTLNVSNKNNGACFEIIT